MWGLQTKFMHYPTGFDSIWSSVPIKHQSLSHPYDLACRWVEHRSIFSSGFPVPRCCCPIGPEPCGILAVAETEEVPLMCIELGHL